MGSGSGLLGTSLESSCRAEYSVVTVCGPLKGARGWPQCFRVPRRPWPRGSCRAACAARACQLQAGLERPGIRAGGGAPRGARVHGEPGSWGARGSSDGAGREGLRILGSLPEAAFRRLTGCLAIVDSWNLEKDLLLIKLRDVAEKSCSPTSRL